MDPFTQRMLERARARREKIDSKLANNGQEVTPRKPLAEKSAPTAQSATPTVKSPERKAVVPPTRRPSKDSHSSPAKSPARRLSSDAGTKLVVRSPARRTSQDKKTSRRVGSPNKSDFREVCVTTTEYPRTEERTSDVSVEINIVHRDDIHIQVQVEEQDAPLTVYPPTSCTLRRIQDGEASASSDKENVSVTAAATRCALRHNAKSQLDRLGVLYSDKELSSPIHRTETEFTSATPPPHSATPRPAPSEAGKRKLARLAALADTINNWEDDTTHHTYQKQEAPSRIVQQKQEVPSRMFQQKKEVPSKAVNRSVQSKCDGKDAKLDESTLDVSIHSLRDIGRVVDASKSADKSSVSDRTYKKPAPAAPKSPHRLNESTVAALEAVGYRRDTSRQSRLVYDFSTKNADRSRQEPSSTPSRKMATAVATHAVVKKPSIKKYKAPTPPRKEDTTDSQNNVVDNEVNDNEVSTFNCIQTNREPIKTEETASNKSSPVCKRPPKLNGHDGEIGSVLSKAAIFENGSPFQRDPTTMSIRERKALFEKNKGAAIVPKAPFGQAPSAKMLQGTQKAAIKPVKPLSASTALTNSPISKSKSPSKSASRESLPQETGGIKNKLAALLNKEQTISEATIGEKLRNERKKELDMLQNRFHYKPKSAKHADSDSDGEPDPSEKAPLMSSSLSLNPGAWKPEVVDAREKSTSMNPIVWKHEPSQARMDKCKSETALHARNEEDVVGSQPAGKRRSSQDSPVVLSVLEDVKRIKMQPKSNGTTEPGLYPHLSDIETATSSAPDDDTDCGGSRCGHYALDMEDVSEKKHLNKLNTSENWAETSFGRDIMQAVKKKTDTRTVSFEQDLSTASASTFDSDMDELLDEALDEVTDDTDGPTPPKQNKSCNSLSSKSFTYKDGTPKPDFKAPKSEYRTPLKSEFKSPLKSSTTPAQGEGRKEDLVHSVSFYRRMQSATSQPSTPVRAVRHTQQEETSRAPDDGETERVMTVRQKISELQAEISKQQTIISQASQALNLCAATIEFSGSTEQAEGERLLLLATHRRQACLHEAQRLQVEGPGPAAERGAVSLTLSRLSVPLRRDYVRQLNADGAVGHHCVCLLKCRDRVIATCMKQTQPDSNTLCFPDQIQMEGLAGDFKVTIEVYLLQASKELLPHDVKYHISNKKPSSRLLTPKSKVSELKAPRVQSPGGPSSVRSPQLQPHGYCIFALQQAKRTSFTLNKVPPNSPLDGSIGVHISAVLSLPAPAPHAAFLTAFDDVSGLGAWHRRWCVLQPPRLSWWKYPDDVRKKLPMGDLDLATVVSDKVTRAPRDLCARPHTLLLESGVEAGAMTPEGGSLVYRTRDDGAVVRRHLLAADTQEDRDSWLEALNKALAYVRCNQRED